MPAAVGPSGALYAWRDGSTSSLAPPSDSIDVVLQNPTQWAVESGTAISHDRIYREQPWVGAAARFLAGQVARLPLHRFIRTDDGDQERDRKSMFARALRRPAPRRTAHQLKRDIGLDLAVNGNHLEEIITKGSTLEFHRILWKHARPIYNPARTRIDGWEIHDQGTGEKPRELSNFDVVHFALGATDALLGVSPLEQLGTSLRIDRAAQAHQLATLRNAARVGVVVVIDPAHAKNPDVVEAARMEFQARYGGIPNSGRPFVAAGIDIKSVPQQTLVEAELIKQRQITREEASAIYQLPTSFLGDMSKATQNNFSETYRQLFKTTLPEMLDLIGETFDRLVLDEHPQVAQADSFTRFNLDAIMYGDPGERAQTYERMLGVGGITVNEIRGLEQRRPFEVPEASLPLIKISNYQPLGADPAPDPAAPPPADPPPGN